MHMKNVLKTLIFTMLLMAAGLSAQAQQVISGVITDEAGIPLPGATVFIVETNEGVVSNFEGEYSIGEIRPFG